jgi:hypothetical protein
MITPQAYRHTRETSTGSAEDNPTFHGYLLTVTTHWVVVGDPDELQ